MFRGEVTAEALIEEIKALAPAERQRVVKFIIEQVDSWIPESFKVSMAYATHGRLVEMESALHKTPPPYLV